MESKNQNQDVTNIYNLIILDESGSMWSIYHQALDGANETIKSIKNAQLTNSDQNQFLTFVTFSSYLKESVRTIIDNKPILQVKTLGRDDYRPNGGTPLYDAIGCSLTSMEQKVKESDQVLVTIITDGHENSSKEYNLENISKMVERLRAKGWTFVYMGANQDAKAEAHKMNIQNSMEFAATKEGTEKMWRDYRKGNAAYYQKVQYAKMRGERYYEDNEFFSSNQGSERVTPKHINNLKSGEIFVFGSNTGGLHNGGAARLACLKFGAVYGNGYGPQGQSYAIPTVGCSLNEMGAYINNFIDYAMAHPQLTFLVTPIGCGIAGYTPDQIAPMFAGAVNVENIHLPEEFWFYLR